MECVIIYAVATGVVGMIIIALSSFTLYVIFRCSKLHRVSQYPIISFLLVAFIQGGLVCPSYLMKRLTEAYSLDSTLYCDLFRFPYFLCGHISNLSILIVSIDRFIAIKTSFQYSSIVTKPRMLVVLALMWVSVLCFDILPFTRSRAADAECYYNPWKEWSLVAITATIIIPFLLISFHYFCLIKFAAIKAKERPSSRRQRYITRKMRRSNKHRLLFLMELKATRTSILLLAIFLICWGPLGVYYIIDNVSDGHLFDGHTQRAKSMIRYIIKLISFTSSILTPIVYCWRAREFKREFRKRIYRKPFTSGECSLPVFSRFRKQGSEVTRSTVTSDPRAASHMALAGILSPYMTRSSLNGTTSSVHDSVTMT